MQVRSSDNSDRHSCPFALLFRVRRKGMWMDGWRHKFFNEIIYLFIYTVYVRCTLCRHAASVPFSHKMLPKHRNECETIFRRKGSLCKFGLWRLRWKKMNPYKNQCSFFSNDPSTPPLLLLLFGWKNKFMYLIMRATIAVIIFLLSSNQLPLVCHSKKLLIINNIGECFLSASSATSSYLCCPFVARFEECHVILRHIISARVLIWDTNQQRSGVMA